MSLGLRSRPRRRALHVASVAAVVTSVITASALVWQASYSALSATTTNGSNTWAVGSVNLTDDDSGTAMFTATNLKPGSTGTKCIAVTSSGSLPSSVKLYGGTYSNTNSLGAYLDLSIQLGTGGTFAGGCGSFVADGTNPTVYTGTLAAFASASTAYGSGQGVWAPTGSGSETRVYKFTYTVNSGAPNTIAGGTAAITFTWEAQNT